MSEKVKVKSANQGAVCGGQSPTRISISKN